MKNWIFAFGVLIGLVSCNSKPSQLQSIENKSVEKFIDWNLYIDKFKFKNLKSFGLKGDSIEKELVKIDNDLFFKVTQDSFHYDNCYFYSFQSQDSNFTKLTILHKSLEWFSDIIWYLIYDKNGKLLSKTAVAELGSDEDWSIIEKSKFVNDTILILNSNENLFGETDDSEVKNIKKIKEITILNNGKTKVKLISENEKISKIDLSKPHRIPTIRCN